MLPPAAPLLCGHQRLLLLGAMQYVHFVLKTQNSGFYCLLLYSLAALHNATAL